MPDAPARNPSTSALVRAVGNVVLVVVVLSMLVAPLAWFGGTRNVEFVERRERRPQRPFPMLADASEADDAVGSTTVLNLVAGLPSRLEAWFADRIGGRPELVRVRNGLRVAGLVPVAMPRSGDWRTDVLVGGEGWLYVGDLRVVDDFRGVNPFDEERLRAWIDAFEERRRWTAERGIEYLVVLAPNKSTAYPEHVPASMTPTSGRRRIDQLVERLRAGGTVPLLDLRAELRRARGTHRTYHRTDTHWNTFGAHVGYRATMRRLRQWFPDVEPIDLASYELTRTIADDTDLAAMIDSGRPHYEERLGLRPLFEPAHVESHSRETEEAWSWSTRENPSAPPLRAVVVHDSFVFEMLPFLDEHFRRVDYVWTWDFTPRLVEEARPHVVVQLLVERALQTHVPSNPIGMRDTPTLADRPPTEPTRR